jgi:preprotein translocase subunit Sec61beta
MFLKKFQHVIIFITGCGHMNTSLSLSLSSNKTIFEFNATLITEKARINSRGLSMSRKKKESAPMPAASAGLLRFFEEETEGIKIRPEFVAVAAIALIIVCILARVFF